jgi:tetratricopeptide (TPR) repeat protein
MRCSIPLLAGLFAFLVSVAAAGDDPWAVPSPNGAILTAKITTSEREYAIILCDEPQEGAGGPERAELSLSKSERRVLERCRKSIADEKYEESEKILAGQMRRNPANYAALGLLARSQAKRGDHEAALESLRRSLIGNRRNPDAWTLLEEVAAALKKKVVRPQMTPRAFIRPPENGEVRLGYWDAGKDGDFAWYCYAVARAFYRYEGPFGKDFPKAKEYRFSFREQLYAVGAAVSTAVDSEHEITEELTRLLAEKKSGTLVPFVFFALYPEPIPRKPEKDFDKLVPRLTEYFDSHIVVAKD